MHLKMLALGKQEWRQGGTGEHRSGREAAQQFCGVAWRGQDRPRTCWLGGLSGVTVFYRQGDCDWEFGNLLNKHS